MIVQTAVAESAKEAAAVPRGAVTLEDVDGGSGTPIGYAGQKLKSVPKEEPKEAKVDIAEEAEESSEEESEEKKAAVDKAIEKISDKLSDGDKKSETDKTSGDEKAAKDVKFYTAKHGDTKTKLPVDATFKHVVNGESVVVTLGDLLNDFSGKTDWTKKYSDLNKERQEYNAQVKELNTQLGGLHKMLTEKGDARSVLMTLAEAFGADPKAVWKQFAEKAKEQIQEFSNLTEEQWKLKELEEELSWRNHKEEKDRQKAEAAEVEKSINDRVQSVLQKTKMDEQTFLKIYNFLRDEKGVPVSELSPERVEEEYVERETAKTVSELIDSVNPDMPAERKAKAMEDMRKAFKANPEFTKDDWRDIAVEAFGNESAKNLSKKLKKSGNKPTPKHDKVISARQAPISFDELE